MKYFESFVLDDSNECLWHDGAQIALANKPFSVLRYLVENPGRLVTHDELLDALWPTTYVQPQVLRTYVLELRKVLSDDPKNPKFIKTIPKRGYSFVAKITDQANSTFGVASARGILMQDVSTSELVGRDVELACLQKMADLAASGHRQLVFITGEAGIGKTSLINALRKVLDVTTPQACMACGHCVEGLSEKEDYYPLLEAFGQCFALTDQEGGLPAGHARRLDFHDRPGELCETLEELSRERMVILVIEDIQWAHESTLKLISALARRGTPAKLLIIAEDVTAVVES